MSFTTIQLKNARLSYTSLKPPTPNEDNPVYINSEDLKHKARGDQRGTLKERRAAWEIIKPRDEGIRRNLGVHANILHGKVKDLLRPKFLTEPYAKWGRWHEAAWSKVLREDGREPLPYTGQMFIYSSPILGKRATGMIIDPLQQETTVKQKKQPKKAYNTIGVRFLRGHNLEKVYTYRVPKKVKLHLGEEIVVPSQPDGSALFNSIACVVELHPTPQDTEGHDYKFVTGRIQKIK